MKNLQDLQLRKKQAEKKIMIGTPLIIIGVLFFVFLPDLFFIGILFGLVSIGFLAKGSSEYSHVSRTFKQDVVTDLVKQFIEDGQFDQYRGLGLNEVYETEFLKRADRYHTEDYISGKISGVSFVSSDVKLEERHVRHTKNGTQTYYETYFLGRIFIFDFNKSFDGFLQVLEHGRPTVNRGYEKVKLESVVFNKKFKTFTTNEHSAFYVLTPHFMEALMRFEQNNRGAINFSFINNRLYIGIDNRRDTFTLRMFQPLNEETIKEFERDLLVVKEVIDELKLNNRIFK